MSTDPRTGITLLSTQQRYKEQLINEAIAHLGAVATGAIASLELSAPPSSPTVGSVYFVPVGATGAWLAHEKKFALKTSSGWSFYSIPLNHRIYSQSPPGSYYWDGEQWVLAENSGNSDNADRLGGELPSYYLDLTNHTGELPAESLPGSLKVILQSPKTLHVSPTGLSINNGESPASPKSLQSAIDTFVNGYIIDEPATIAMADGVYQVSGLNVSGFQGNSQIRLVGNISDPSAVTITNSPTALINADGGMWILLVAAANLAVNGITFKTSAHNTEETLNAVNLIYSFIDSRLSVNNCVFDATYSYSSNPYLGAISCSTNTRTVLGGTIDYKGTFNLINAVDGGSFIHNTGGETGTSITFGTGTTFDNNVVLLNGAFWTLGDATYTGSPTGKKFSISGNSILGSGGIDPNTAIAGTISGTVNNWLGHPFNTVVTGTGGEANTASNTETAGLGIYKTKVGVDLVFKRIKEGANMAIVDNGDSLEFSSTATGGSASFNSNEETLSANKTLTNSDVSFQYLNPGTANRDIVLPSSPTTNKYFRVRSTNGTNNLIIKEGTLTLVSLGNSVDNGSGSEIRLMADFHYTGTKWIVNLY